MKIINVFALLFIVLTSGCLSSARRDSSTPTKYLKMEELELRAISGRNPQILDEATLFEEGLKQLKQKNYQRALDAYQQLLTNFPKSEYVPDSIFNAALAQEGLRQFSEATANYERLLKHPHWPAAKRLEVLASLGQLYVLLENRALALRYFNETLQLSQALRLAEPSSLEDQQYFAAMAHYYLATLLHRDFRKIDLLPDETLSHALDEKARLLLETQNKYIAAIKIHHTYWATAAGFQIAALYREFYLALMQATPNLSPSAREDKYQNLLHGQVKILLEKAIGVLEKNILVAERTGLHSVWEKRSRQLLEELQAYLTASKSWLAPEQIRLLQESVVDDFGEEIMSDNS